MVFKLAGPTPQKSGRSILQRVAGINEANGASRFSQYQDSIEPRYLDLVANQEAVNYLHVICAEYRHVSEGAVHFTGLVLHNAQRVNFHFVFLQGKLLLQHRGRCIRMRSSHLVSLLDYGALR